MIKPKIKDRVRILQGCADFYSEGDIAMLDFKDEDEDWWATFSNGEQWCIGPFRWGFIVDTGDK